jgi:hypothetical protein
LEDAAKRWGLTFSPSDLNDFLACPHLTSLRLAIARGEISPPYRHNPHADLIRRKGEEWEAAYLAELRAQGREVIEPGDAAATEEALRRGADVVYQAILTDGRWLGKADFVERQRDGWYEVVDTKLARPRGRRSSSASTAKEQWERDDHLTLVAGVSQLQHGRGRRRCTELYFWYEDRDLDS